MTHMPRRHSLHLTFLLSLFFLACITGCSGLKDKTIKPVPEPPSFSEFVKNYNTNLEHLDRIWARTVVVLRWVDEDGNKHKEQGEGHFQFVLYPTSEKGGSKETLRSPAKIAFDVGKLGNIGYWLGCDADRFWWIDAQDTHTAYVAKHSNLFRPCCRTLNLPFHPLEMIELLALTPLSETASTGRIEINKRGNAWVVTVDSLFSKKRMIFDPHTNSITRVELLDRTGKPVIWSELTEYEPMEITGLSPDRWPSLPRIIYFHQSDDEMQAKISFSGVTDASRDRRKLRDAAFNFEIVRRGLGIQDTVILDADCEGEAG